MDIKQFRYSSDNLGYLVYSGDTGIAIDGGAVDETLLFADRNNISIRIITNTHSHYDHTPGNKELLKRTSGEFLDPGKIRSDQTVAIGKEVLNIFHAPGHTLDSIIFWTDDFLVTGDTLFNGTVGNCFSNDFNAFFNSLKRVIAFPGSTRIYAGHDYVEESLEIAGAIDTGNPDIEKYMKKYNPHGEIVSTLEDELKVNPYIRFNEKGMIEKLKARRLPVDTEFERFKSIMENY